MRIECYKCFDFIRFCVESFFAFCVFVFYFISIQHAGVCANIVCVTFATEHLPHRTGSDHCRQHSTNARNNIFVRSFLF